MAGVSVNIAPYGEFSGNSYRESLRARQSTVALLPSDFKLDFFHRKSDTYVGYEKKNNRPRAKVLSPKDVRSLEPVHESMLDITHHWLSVDVQDPDFSQYRIWFQFRRAKRDVWHGRLAEICKK